MTKAAKRKRTTTPPTELTAPPDALVVAADFPTCAPDSLFAYWTVPDPLRRWWPPTASVESRVGGTYHFAWTAPDRHLHGTYTAFTPGATLDFTWRWDHAPADRPAREVIVIFAPLDARGTHLIVTHGTDDDSPEERAERRGHLKDWLTALSALQRVVAPG